LSTPGIDLLQRGERRIRARLDRWQARSLVFARLCLREAEHTELSGSDGRSRGADKAAATMVDFFGCLDVIHW
jgi:hypothetical protein